MYTEKDHSFVICAYKENPYLPETIQSLKNQTKSSKILLSTSTPNEYLKNICKKYEIEMIVNPNPKNAGTDWNYAYDHAPTQLVTIAHQDDLYEPTFLEDTLQAISENENFILAFTDYYELKKDSKETSNILLKIKRLMNWPLSKRIFQTKKYARKFSLSLGCAICCPAVTICKANAGESIFDTTFINSCDYKTWCDLADKDGSFIYIKKQLLAHRIYAESATTKNLSDNIRQKEDFEIFCKFWPKSIAALLNKVYAMSEKSNKV